MRLKEIIEFKRPDVVKFLGEGVSRSELESKIKNLSIPQSLIDLYSCMSSYPERERHTVYLLTPDRDLIYVGEIYAEIDLQLKLCEKYNDLEGAEFFTNAIPFLENGAGDSVWVKNQVNDNSVWLKMKESDPEKIYESIDHFLLTAITCYEREAYYYDEEEDFWDMDFDMESRIAEELRHLFIDEDSEES
jgi:hypothetical protein